MSSIAVPAITSAELTRAAPDRARRFAICALGLVVGACLLAGWAPLGFSIVTVFLFAGPHNWLEARYFLSRLPARWGPLRAFFITAFAGVFVLTAGFVAVSWVARFGSAGNGAALGAASAAWNSALVLWITALVYIRGREGSRRQWIDAWPIAIALVGASWLWPSLWGLVLVYAHPLVALWILDLELRRRRSTWHAAYRRCLIAVPLLLALLWWRLAGAPNLPGDDALSIRIAQHAGASVLPRVSSHLLVATHTFLEMLHYGVWVLAIPLVSAGAMVSRPVVAIPLARRSGAWRRVVICVIATGALVVVLLWAAFLANYPATRDLYFTVAILHVLAEAPFLLRAL